MIHQSTELREVSKAVGLGVFATDFIPAGTVTYAKDLLEIQLSPTQFSLLRAPLKDAVYKYSFIEPDGSYVLSWDNAKYVNHSCECNTIMTGYGFEIAIRDIYPGEELTDEYALFNIDDGSEFKCLCRSQHCRGTISTYCIDVLYPIWDERIISSLSKFHTVEQPLAQLIDAENEVFDYFNQTKKYRSVLSLKMNTRIVEST